jgi:FkbM family methyltransferase
MKMSFGEKLRSLFDDPFREVRAFGVEVNRIVADVGAGFGYFTVAAADVVGPRGIVYSVEPDPARNERIVGRAESEGLSNVRVLRTKAEDMNEIPPKGRSTLPSSQHDASLRGQTQGDGGDSQSTTERRVSVHQRHPSWTNHQARNP